MSVVKRLFKWVKRLVICALLLALVVLLVVAWMIHASVVVPPPLPSDKSVLALKP